jgi:PAS domain S-box-containing protein
MQINQRKLPLVSLKDTLESNYQKLIDSSPIGMFAIQDGLFCYCNSQFAQILGYEIESLINEKGFNNLVYAVDQLLFEEKFTKFLASDLDADHLSLRLTRKDKDIFNAEIYYAKLNLNGKFTMIGSLLDVTENKNIKEQLDILASTVKSAGECVTIIDLDHRIFFVNKTLCETYGYKAEELLGKHVGILYENVVEGPEFQKIIRATYQTGWEGELLRRRKDGVVIPTRLSTTVIRDKNNKPLALAGFSKDISDQKKIIEDLHNNEKKLRTLIDKMPIGFIYMKKVFDEQKQNIDFEIIQVNKAFENVMQIRGEDIIGQTISSQFPGIYKIDLNILDIFEKVCVSKTDEKFEFYSSKRDGYYSISVYSPEENYLVALVDNITSRKKAEDELLKSQQMLRTILDNIPQKVFWKDRNSIFKGCNIHFAKDLGFERPEEIIGKSDYDLDYEGLADEFISCDRYVMDNDDVLLVDCEKHYKPDGTPYWIRLNRVPLKDKDNRIFGVIGTYEDISKQKAIEERIRKLSQAVEQSPASIVITDLNANIEYVNPKFTRLTGYTFEEVRGKNPRILKSGKMSAKTYEEMWKTILSGQEWVGEFHNRKKNGELYWEYASISPIKDADGKITHYLAVKEDITKLKSFETELKTAKEKAEEMNHLKSVFLANISHELRTPLIGIIGYAETLFNEIENSEYKEMAHTLLKSGKRLKETLNLLLDLSHIEAEKIDVTLIPQNLTQIILEKIKVFNFAAQEKGLSFQMIIKEENLVSRIDESMFNQIIENLFNNALKYTHKGEISIMINKIEENEMSFASIIVKDTGIGIPGNCTDLIFEPFRQVSEGPSRTFEGLGLGLTITKRFVEAMGGRIFVKSEVGVGTEFIVYLPLDKNEQMIISSVETADNLVTHKNSLNQKYQSKILLVEDDEPTAKVIKIYLKELCLIDWANTGEKAIEMAKNQLYSIVMIDINLGVGIDGLETLKEIKKINGYENTSLISVTAYAMHGDKEEFLKQGCTHYISKPFDKREICSLIDQILTEKVVK